MKLENLATIFYIVIGIILGYASFLIHNNMLGGALAVAGFFTGAFVLKIILKELKGNGMKWFFSSGGGWIYFFVWFIVWIMFYNL